MVNPSQANSPDMKNVKIASAAVLLCVIQGAGARTLQGAGSPIMGILQSELQRNMQVLRHQDVPAYFGAYTVYDEHSTQIVASFGAIDCASVGAATVDMDIVNVDTGSRFVDSFNCNAYQGTSGPVDVGNFDVLLDLSDPSGGVISQVNVGAENVSTAGTIDLGHFIFTVR